MLYDHLVILAYSETPKFSAAAAGPRRQAATLLVSAPEESLPEDLPCSNHNSPKQTLLLYKPSLNLHLLSTHRLSNYNRALHRVCSCVRARVCVCACACACAQCNGSTVCALIAGRQCDREAAAISRRSQCSRCTSRRNRCSRCTSRRSQCSRSTSRRCRCLSQYPLYSKRAATQILEEPHTASV